MDMKSENDMSSISSTLTEEEPEETCTVEEYFIDSCRYNDKQGVDECFKFKFNILAHDGKENLLSNI